MRCHALTRIDNHFMSDNVNSDNEHYIECIDELALGCEVNFVPYGHLEMKYIKEWCTVQGGRVNFIPNIEREPKHRKRKTHIRRVRR